ncbi:MAG: helix-turn-helix domain-containing protein [Vicinamibacterales bacterium]
MPLSVQVKLLRVLQNRVIERVGGTRAIPVDVRTITGTKGPQAAGWRGKVPRGPVLPPQRHPDYAAPLRERREDIPLLATHFLNRFYARREQDARPLSPGVLQAFMRYPWPGNVRELENACERIAQTCTCDTVKIGCVPVSVLFHRSAEDPEPIVQTHGHPSSVSLEDRLRDVEQGLITWALKVAGGNKSKAAELLQIKRSTLGDRIKKLGLPDVGADEPASRATSAD